MRIKTILTLIFPVVMFAAYPALATQSARFDLTVINKTEKTIMFKFIGDNDEVIYEVRPMSPNWGFGVDLAKDNFDDKHDKTYKKAAVAFENQEGWMTTAQSRRDDCIAIAYKVPLSSTLPHGAWDENLYGIKYWTNEFGGITGVHLTDEIPGSDDKKWEFVKWEWGKDVSINDIKLQLMQKAEKG